jgi:hypothetical protein
MKDSYGLQINGSPFVAYNINSWIRNGNVPIVVFFFQLLYFFELTHFQSSILLAPLIECYIADAWIPTDLFSLTTILGFPDSFYHLGLGKLLFFPIYSFKVMLIC